MGAGIGAGGVAGAALGRQGYGRYARMRGLGIGRGQAAGAAFRSMGDLSRGFVGRSYNRAVNAFRGRQGL